MPQRIQLHRTKGWRKPPDAVVIARPSRWGNPYKLGVDGDRAECAALYEAALRAGRLGFTTDDVRRELAGRVLACWCPLELECHGDVLLRIANGG